MNVASHLKCLVKDGIHVGRIRHRHPHPPSEVGSHS